MIDSHKFCQDKTKTHSTRTKYDRPSQTYSRQDEKLIVIAQEQNTIDSHKPFQDKTKTRSTRTKYDRLSQTFFETRG
jgi:hypothetical protein